MIRLAIFAKKIPFLCFSKNSKQKQNESSHRESFPNHILANLRFEKSWKDRFLRWEILTKSQRRRELSLINSSSWRWSWERWRNQEKTISRGVIGCGQIGQLLLSKLLEESIGEYFRVHQTTWTSIKFEPMGVRCANDNEMVCKRASVMLCGQHHIKLISAELRGLVRQNAVLVSSLADVTGKTDRVLDGTRTDLTKSHWCRENVQERKRFGLACSELCANKATGLREIYGAMVF